MADENDFKDTVPLGLKNLAEDSSRAGLGSITSRHQDAKATDGLRKFFKPAAERAAEQGEREL